MSTAERTGCPDGVLNAIALYPDQLDEERRSLVEAHAAECPDCRQELPLMAGRWQAEGEPAQEARAPSELRDRPSAMAAVVALTVLVAAVGAVGGLWLQQPDLAVYETVSAPPAAPTAPAAAIDVVFRPEATVQDVQAALGRIGGQIVSGPTGLGVYRVDLGPAGDQQAAARTLREDEQDVITFAEPALR